MLRLNINGKLHEVDADPETPLLWVIREWIGLTGTKYGCGIAQCGACTVHVDGVATRSCSLPAGSVGAAGIPRSRAFLPTDSVIPCRRPGSTRGTAMRLLPVRPDHGCRIVAATEARPDRRGDRRGVTNICRCGTYQRIREAIHTAATLTVPVGGKA